LKIFEKYVTREESDYIIGKKKLKGLVM